MEDAPLADAPLADAPLADAPLDTPAVVSYNTQGDVRVVPAAYNPVGRNTWLVEALMRYIYYCPIASQSVQERSVVGPETVAVARASDGSRRRNVFRSAAGRCGACPAR